MTMTFNIEKKLAHVRFIYDAVNYIYLRVMKSTSKIYFLTKRFC